MRRLLLNTLLIVLLVFQIKAQSWESVSGLPSDRIVTELDILSIDNGIAVDQLSRVWLTINSSESWEENSFGGGITVNGIEKIDESSFWLMGSGGTISKGVIQGAGISYGPFSVPTTNGINNCHFIDSENGWYVGNSGTLLQTQNGGALITIKPIPGLNQNFNDIAVNGSIGIIITNTTASAISRNGGKTWSSGPNLPAPNGIKIDYQFGSFWVLTSESVMMRSSDGENWTTVSMPSNRINDFTFFDGKIYISGSQGESYVSNTNGNQWIEINGVPTANDLFAVSCNENGCFTGGALGSMFWLCERISVGGYVWGDTNGDCSRNSSIENGYKGIEIILENSNGNEVDRTTSNEDGFYEFVVDEGMYNIVIPSNNFTLASPLYAAELCGMATNANTNTPNDQNGALINGRVELRENIDLRCAEELGPLGVVNHTVDFGFDFSCSSNPTDPVSFANCNNPNTTVCNLTSLENNCYLMQDFISNVSHKSCFETENSTNLTWYVFSAGIGNYSIDITKNGCFPGTSGEAGFKVGVVTDCNDQNQIYCEDLCQSGGVASISSSILTPGKDYYIWIDGCDGSYCGYTVDITGSYAPFTIPTPSGLSCNNLSCDVICLDSEVSFTAEDAQSILTDIDAQFEWNLFLNGVMVTNSILDTNVFTYEYNLEGTYELCLDNIENECEVKNTNLCRSFDVKLFEDEYFGQIGVCENEIVSYPGPTFVNDDPSESNDPNNDGFIGWDMSTNHIFENGQNTQLVTNQFGCEYEQFFDLTILQNVNGGTENVIVCSSDEFPVYFGDQNYFTEVEGLNITFPDPASNGCDSTMILNITHLEIEGSIIQNGCDSSGVQLEFSPSLIQNTFNHNLQGHWTDQNGLIIPDDGDNNIYTTTVPFEQQTYIFNAYFIVNGVNSCSYSFEHQVLFAKPSITATDSICVNDQQNFVFSLPNGVNATPLWNLDNGIIDGIFELNTPISIHWEEPGQKLLTLAYLLDGCYVEEQHTITILPKYVNNDFQCTAEQNSLSFSWPNLDYNTIQNIEVLTGQSGQSNGNQITFDNLRSSETVDIRITVSSAFCDSYNIEVSCSTSSCDGIDGLDDIYECTSSIDHVICDLSELGAGCSTLDSVTTTIPDISCINGSLYNVKWIPFVAGNGEYNITLSIMGCDSTMNEGVQYAIFNDCNLSNPVYCDSICYSDSILIKGSELISGNTYQIMLNGCNGSVCDYTIDVDQNFESFELPEITDIAFNGSIVDTLSTCINSTNFAALVSLQDLPYSQSTSYFWVISDLISGAKDTIITNEPLIPFIADSISNYSLCLENIEHICDGDEYSNLCTIIEVEGNYDAVEIQCTSTKNEVVFTWSPESGHTGYTVNVLTGQSGILSGTSFTVSNLNANEMVTIELITDVDNGCQSLSSQQSCSTEPCPQINVIIDDGGPFYFCHDNSPSLEFDFTPFITPDSSGIGFFSGNGIIDSIEGYFDIILAGVGNHVVTYTFETPDGCIYQTSSDVIITSAIEASFTISEKEICINDSVTIVFDGVKHPQTEITWDFSDMEILGEVDSTSFVLTHNEIGYQFISLILEDDQCGVYEYIDSIQIISCETCVCTNIIDTTVTCSTVFEPVCGCNGVTYDNACQAQFYGGVKNWTNGPCTQMEIDTIYAVCDDNNPNTVNDTYNDDCICEGTIVDHTLDFDQEITYYPNPTKGLLYFKNIKNQEIGVYNSIGTFLLKTRINDNVVDLSMLNSGFYLLKVGNHNIISVIKE